MTSDISQGTLEPIPGSNPSPLENIMQMSELRLSIAAVFADTNATFEQDLKTHVWGQLYGGFHSPASLSNSDLSCAWNFDVQLAEDVEGVLVNITIEARYEVEDTALLVDALRHELPLRLMRDLTVRGKAPIHATLDVCEHPYNAGVPSVLKLAA